MANFQSPPLQIAPLPVTTPLAAKTPSGVSMPWLLWFQRMQAKITQLGTIPGPYANDAAAAAAGLTVGQCYYLPTGVMVVRLT